MSNLPGAITFQCKTHCQTDLIGSNSLVHLGLYLDHTIFPGMWGLLVLDPPEIQTQTVDSVDLLESATTSFKNCYWHLITTNQWLLNNFLRLQSAVSTQTPHEHWDSFVHQLRPRKTLNSLHRNPNITGKTCNRGNKTVQNVK